MSAELKRRARFRLQAAVLALASVICLLFLVVPQHIAQASDITGADYTAIVRVTNNSTAATVVSVPITGANTSNLISSGYLNADADNCTIQSGAGADVPFMPGYATGPWCMFVASIASDTITDYNWYSQATGGDINYFPSDAGMTVTDAAGIELADNGSIEINGVYIDTSYDAPSSSNQSDLMTASMLSQSGLGGWNAANLIDGNPATDSFQTDTSAAGSYMKINFGYKVALTGWRYYVDGAVTATWNIQYSDNNSTWTTAYTGLDCSGGAGWKSATWASVGEHQYWRSYKTNAAAGGNYHSELDITGYVIDKTIVDKDAAISALITASGNITLELADNAIIMIPSVSTGEYDFAIQRATPFYGMGLDVDAPIVPPTNGLKFNDPFWQTNCSTSPFPSIDSNGYTNTVNGSTWTSTGYSFDGNDEITFADLADLAYIQNTGVFTICGWAQLDDYTADRACNLIGNTVTSVEKGFQFIYDNRSAAGATKQFRIDIEKGTAGIPGITSYSANNVITDNGWHMWAVSGNGTHVYFSVDGAVWSTGTSSIAGLSAGNSTRKAHFGMSPAAANTHFMVGDIGTVIAYTSKLTDAQLEQVYDATRSKFTSGDIYLFSILTAVPGTSTNYVFGDDDATPYFESAGIDIGGVPTAAWTWEYGATFSDSIGSYDATPGFRGSSSDADVSAAFLSFRPISEALAPAYAVSAPPDFVTGNITASGNFTTAGVTGSGFPGEDVIDAAATGAGVANIWLWGIIGIVTIALAGLGVSALERYWGGGAGTIFIRLGIAVIVMGVMVTLDIYDFWMLVMYLFIALAPALASMARDIAPAHGQLNLIGFLATVWIGLTTINRIQEGQLITAAETEHLNTLMFTQEFTLLDVFHVPIVNFEFFSKGLPSLLKWDYSFFGGNAQLIQYFLYSLTAIVSFIVLILVFGVISSYFTRRA